MDPKWSKSRFFRGWLYGQEDVAARMKPDMVGEGFDCDHPIVDMCEGVPLALLCMFSAMAMVREQQEQHVDARRVQHMIMKQVERSGIHNTPGFEPFVESLQLGYDDLPHHMLKTCLLYCSIYPENYRFHGDSLAMRWPAEGFIDTEDAAKGYFEELVNRGLMLQVDYGLYRMNSMMRNFLRWKSHEDNFITSSSDITSAYARRIHRLCIDSCPEDDGAVKGVDLLLGLDWSQIRSLVVFEVVERLPFEKLEHMRLLDLQFLLAAYPFEIDLCNNHNIKEICGLLRVRHLFGLVGKEITEIPPEIARLQYLETLQVIGTLIGRLPSEIGRLKKLKTLDMRYNQEITKLPREIGDLQHLKRLLLSGTKNLKRLPREIRGLKKLKILELDETIAVLPWEAGQLSKLEGVPECVRQASKNSDLMSELAGEILSIQMVSQDIPSGDLIVGTKHMHIPQWTKDHFSDLTSLDIRICKPEEQDLKILREMPNLAVLTLRFEVVPRKPIAISGEGFPRLKTLVVDSRMPLVTTFQEGAMPMLRTLDLEFQFYGGLPNEVPQLGIKHLRRLRLVTFRCNEELYSAAESSPCISAMIKTVRKEAQEHPNHIELFVSGRNDEEFPANKSAQVPEASSSGAGEMGKRD